MLGDQHISIADRETVDATRHMAHDAGETDTGLLPSSALHSPSPTPVDEHQIHDDVPTSHTATTIEPENLAMEARHSRHSPVVSDQPSETVRDGSLATEVIGVVQSESTMHHRLPVVEESDFEPLSSSARNPNPPVSTRPEMTGTTVEYNDTDRDIEFGIPSPSPVSQDGFDAV